MPDQPQVECIADVGAILGEGPVWVEREQAVYWVDIKGRKIFRVGADGGLDEFATPTRVGSLAPRAGGGFVAGTDKGLALVDLDAGCFDVIADPEAGIAGNRFNDGKVDRSGRFWAGTMDEGISETSGALYRLDRDSTLSVVDRDYIVANGPAFSVDGRRMYHNDSARQVTYIFELDADGNALSRREFARYGKDDGFPDGMTVDADNCLWIAFWDGWCLRRYSPAGDLLARLAMPVQRPTSCAFGGEGLRTLYVTSAREGLEGTDLDRQPLAGGLFAVDAGVRGIAEQEFAG